MHFLLYIMNIAGTRHVFELLHLGIFLLKLYNVYVVNSLVDIFTYN